MRAELLLPVESTACFIYSPEFMLLKLLHGRDYTSDEEKTTSSQLPTALLFENQRGVLGWCFSTSSGVRSPAPSIQPLPLGAELSSPLPYPSTLLLPLLGLQGQRDSCLLPSPLLSALFLFFFFSCAVALTEYGNMFMNLLHQSQPCDKAVSL